jgi:hypothetical protein
VPNPEVGHNTGVRHNHERSETVYVRRKSVPRGDKQHTYYQIVEGYREGGKVRQRVLAHLGTNPTPEAAIEAWEREAAQWRYYGERSQRIAESIRSGEAKRDNRRYFGRRAWLIPCSVFAGENGHPYSFVGTAEDADRHAARDLARAEEYEERVRKVRELPLHDVRE